MLGVWICPRWPGPSLWGWGAGCGTAGMASLLLVRSGYVQLSWLGPWQVKGSCQRGPCTPRPCLSYDSPSGVGVGVGTFSRCAPRATALGSQSSSPSFTGLGYSCNLKRKLKSLSLSMTQGKGGEFSPPAPRPPTHLPSQQAPQPPSISKSFLILVFPLP